MAFIFSIMLGLLTFANSPAHAQSSAPRSPEAQYVSGVDSLRRPNAPRGERFEFTFNQSRVFPGTVRTIEVYVPSQYRAERPACVLIMLDGLGFEAPTVLDNLIHTGDMPVTVAIGIGPGAAPSSGAWASPRYGRSQEFDALNGELARFVLEEILPEVQRRRTANGEPIVLSSNADDRAVAGASTGAIGAFTLAWERPDAFHRVFSAIGASGAARPRSNGPRKASERCWEHVRQPAS